MSRLEREGSIVAEVEEVFLTLFEALDPGIPLPDGGVMVRPHAPAHSEFMRLIDAVWNSEAVEGSIVCDHVMASLMLREKAKLMGYERVANANLYWIGRSLNTVLRRYGMGRKDRRFPDAEE